MSVKKERIGLWLIGACGGVGSTVALGLAAFRKGLATTTGLVGDLPEFQGAGLIDPGKIVLGGHEIRSESLVDAVRASQNRARLFDPVLVRACTPLLRSTGRNIRSGTLCGVSRTVRKMADTDFPVSDRSPAAAVERLSADLREFRKAHRLDHVVVVHVASTEPPAPRSPALEQYAKLRRALARAGSGTVPSSCLYALAAIEAGCAYVNFTPSPGICIPALLARARECGTPYMGNDGKTGETLVKSVLAPMFAMRNLPVLSWVGQNILGNRDGMVLSDPNTRQSKINAKDKTVSRIVGGRPVTHVSIDYVPSLDDWKVAWDFIHFEGFLGTKMSMQFVWQGSDSVLAAPLVIDLARFAALECSAGRSGPMRHLACFFKDPIGTDVYDLFTQWQQLVGHVSGSARA